jgi:DNA-binding MarR family transcriptional regulator
MRSANAASAGGRAAVREVIATRAPPAANARMIWRPMPPVPPVTRTARQEEGTALMHVDAGNLIAILDALEADGLLRRDRDDADRRQRLVRLTTRGRRLLGRALRATDAVETEIFGVLSRPERDAYDDASLSVYRQL